MEHIIKPLTEMQLLLDAEAAAGNAHLRLKDLIKQKRGPSTNAPPCWGTDDCSTAVLVGCPWRIDCGEYDA